MRGRSKTGDRTSKAGSPLSVCKVSKTFGSHRALRDVDLQIAPGEMTALIGPSGSGKSTLLKSCNGLVRIDSGTGGTLTIRESLVQIDGRLSASIRRQRAKIGFIFQNFNLVGRLTLLDNVLIGCSARTSTWRNLLRCYRREDRVEAMEALEQVGLAPYARQRASTLSGGQQQRGAIARCILQKADIILADEPIASLDPKSASLVMDMLTRLNQENGVTVLISLHQVDIAKRYCSRIVALNQGRIHFDGTPKQLDSTTLQQIYGTSEFLHDQESFAQSAPEETLSLSTS